MVSSSFLFLQLMVILRHVISFVQSLAAATPPSTTIKVCQNKDCCKRYQGSANLLQTLENLLPPQQYENVHIEAIDCLSHCGKGPSLQVQHGKNDRPKFIHNVHDPTVAAIELELILEGNTNNDTPTTLPPLLMAAVKVLEKYYKATVPDQQKKLLDSVISKLDEQNNELSESLVNANAYTLRAEWYLEQGKNNDYYYKQAEQDASHAITLFKQIFIKIATNSETKDKLCAQAYRIWSDALEGQGNYEGALTILQQWGSSLPMYRTKVNKEIQRLLSVAAASSG